MNTPYDQLFPLLVNNEIAAYVKKIRAKELWESIIHCAWNTAEPGILFWDNIIDNDPASVYPEFRAISTNPCGEIPLSAYDSCRLIANNLYGTVDFPFTKEAVFNDAKAYQYFYESQIIGDILVDLELEAVKRVINITTGKEPALWFKILEIGQNGRRTGVGITGLSDMLAALNRPYTDVVFIEKIMKLKMEAELDASIDLAIINGPFPAYNKDLEYELEIDATGESFENDYLGLNHFYESLIHLYPEQVERMYKWGRRNCSWSTIAPTGTISILAGTSSGCEPVFSIYYTRRKKCNPGEIADFTDQNGIGFKNYNVIHGKFKEWYSITRHQDPELLTTMPKDELDALVVLSPWHGNTAEEISPVARVQVQSTLQKYTTHSISSTVNVANNVTEKDIATIYSEAYKTGCKGITAYRDGSRSGILIKEEPPKMSDTRPLELDCKVLRFKNEDKKNWISFVGIYNTQAYEIFTGINDLDELPIPSYIESGKIIKVTLPEGSRYDFSYLDKYGYVNTVGGLNRVFNKEYWNYARFVSALLREGTPIDKVIKVIDGLTFTNKGMNSFQAGLIRSLKLFVPDGTEAHGAICENCEGHNIIYEGGCMICRDCGSSKCG
jgi:ribonucleoside-diphosphate reductase alpha chain